MNIPPEIINWIKTMLSNGGAISPEEITDQLEKIFTANNPRVPTAYTKAVVAFLNGKLDTNNLIDFLKALLDKVTDPEYKKIKDAVSQLLGSSPLNYEAVVHALAGVFATGDIPKEHLQVIEDALLGKLDQDKVWGIIEKAIRIQFGASAADLLNGQRGRAKNIESIVVVAGVVAAVQSNALAKRDIGSIASKLDALQEAFDGSDAKKYLDTLKKISEAIEANDIKAVALAAIEGFRIGGSGDALLGMLSSWITDPKKALIDELVKQLNAANGGKAYNKDLVKAVIELITTGGPRTKSDEEIFHEVFFQSDYDKYSEFLRFRRVLFQVSGSKKSFVPQGSDAPPQILGAWMPLDAKVMDFLEAKEAPLLAACCALEFELDNTKFGFTFTEDYTVKDCFKNLMQIIWKQK